MTYKEQRAEQIKEQEYQTYIKFWCDFKQQLKGIKQHNLDNPFSTYDIEVTGSTGQEMLIELKERNYPNQLLSGNTLVEDSGCYIEKHKILELAKIQKLNPDKIIKYFNYTNNGYISFNLTNRFNAKYIAVTNEHLLNDTTFKPSYKRNKAIVTLFFNKKLGDKMSTNN